MIPGFSIDGRCNIVPVMVTAKEPPLGVSDLELVAFARSLAPRVAARAGEIEKARRLPADLAREFADGGLFHALVPREYGGSEAHPASVVEMIREIARGDGSAGWNVMIGTTTGLLAASLSPDFAAEIYGSEPGVLTVGVTAPLGRADVVEGGYEVTGRWPFGSGSENADWICGGCFVFEGDEKRAGKNGAPEHHLMMFRREQVVIEDTWHVSGLRGTGSHHFHVTRQFVPHGRSIIMGSRSHIERPLYQFPLLGLLALGVASVSLGIGLRALEAFKELAGSKIPTGAAKGLGERGLVQGLVAEATADLESAGAYINHTISAAWELAEQGERLPVETKAKLRLAAANATHRSVQAVDKLYQAGGGSSIYDDSVLQRCFRDVHVTTQHIMVATPIYEVLGRVELGLDPRSMV